MSPEALLDILDRAAEAQHRKVLALARRAVPDLTEDDLKNPDDHPVLHHDPRFNYEDGILAGLRSAAAALRAALREG